jgi:outer membrane protein
MKALKFILLTISIIYGNIVSSSIFAADLMDAYQMALKNDPLFKAAHSKWLADKEYLPIARSALFPQISATGTTNRTRSQSESRFSNGDAHYSNTIGYELKLIQPIFNFGNWTQIWGAQATAKQAGATFLAARENLLNRVATAYLNVLLAKDILIVNKANKEFLAQQLNQAKHKFDVGLIAISDLEQARASYDDAVAREIIATNELADKFEELNEITNVRYHNLDTVKNNFPLIYPEPADIEQWSNIAVKQNFDLMAARFATIVARENVKLQNAGHIPTLTAQASYNYEYNDNAPLTLLPGSGFNRSKSATGAIQLDVPVFQGGKVIAYARQADYLYQEQLSKQEQTYRQVVSQTRQKYLGVLSSISQIKANKQTIRSAESSLRAIRAGYSAGIKTMTDVLDAQARLYEAQKNFSNSKYEYINELLTLKALIGALSVADLEQVNSWLVKHETQPNTVASSYGISKKQQTKKAAKASPKKTGKAPVATKNTGIKKAAVIKNQTANKPIPAQPTTANNS